MLLFRSTVVGLAANIVLDPVFIFGTGPAPKLGVAGAAIATVLAQAIVFGMFLLAARKDTVLFGNIRLRSPSQREDWRRSQGSESLWRPRVLYFPAFPW